MPEKLTPDLQAVREYWDRDPCGTRYGGGDAASFFRKVRETRYHLEPWIPTFQNARDLSGQRVLEIGVGLGSDFLAWPRAGALAIGMDLSKASLHRTRDHLTSEDLASPLVHADAEHLPFHDSSFHVVYSYGVLHHSPHPTIAIEEVFRVLKSGGQARIMLYHVPSWTGFLLWVLHYALKGRPWASPRLAIREHLESPGTASYTVREVRELLQVMGFHDVRIRLHLGPGDLLTLSPSNKYPQKWIRTAQKLWPRWLIRALGRSLGIIMLIEASKSS